MSIETIGVVGAGTMGNGIAHVCAKAGFRVVLVEVEQRFLDRGLAAIAKNLAREVEKSKLTSAERDAALARIHGTLSRDALAVCQLVIEAASERFEIKQQIFQQLDQLCPAGDHSRLQHLIHLHHQAGGANQALRIASSACTFSILSR